EEEFSPEPLNPEENVPAFNNGNDCNGNDSGSGPAENGKVWFQDPRLNVLVQDSNTCSSENDDSSRMFNNSSQFRGGEIQVGVNLGHSQGIATTNVPSS
ncbi:unnamed protein product, partial [Allacma fusca]